MRIAYIGEGFRFESKDGISRYSFELYKRLSKRNHIDTYVVKKGDSLLANASAGIRRLVGIRVEGAEIAHVMYPNAAYPITSMPVVLTWHDTALFTRYKTANPLSASFYHHFGVVLPAIRNTKRADGIICVSQSTKKSLLNMLPWAAEKRIVVIPNGVDEAYISTKPYAGERHGFVYVGSVEYAHKNIPFLLDSFEKAVHRGLEEELTIFTPTPKERIPSSYFGRRQVKIVIGAGTGEIAKALARSIALLHFSRLEGFGMPILEALAVGTPAVVLSNADIPEEVTRYAIKVEENAEKAAGVIEELAKSRTAASKEAIAYARSYSWNNTAKKTLAFYKHIAHTGMQ